MTKYNMLTIIEKTSLRSASGSIKYKCRCICGNYTYATLYELKTGHKKSCGCYRESKTSKGIIGKQFGYLTILEHINTDKKGRALYKCRCTCGKEIIVRSDSLKNKNTTSCGCKKIENARIQSNKIRVDDTNIAFIKRALKNNTSKNAISKVKGVYYNKKRKCWYAKITFQKKNYYLGSFKTKEEAIKARKEAEEKYFKNFIDNLKQKEDR